MCSFLFFKFVAASFSMFIYNDILNEHLETQRNSEKDTFQLRTTSVQTPDNIRFNSEQETIRLSNLKPSTARVSIGVRAAIYIITILSQSRFNLCCCTCFPEPVGTVFCPGNPILSHYLYVIAFSQLWINTTSFRT